MFKNYCPEAKMWDADININAASDSEPANPEKSHSKPLSWCKLSMIDTEKTAVRHPRVNECPEACQGQKKKTPWFTNIWILGSAWAWY